MGGGAIRAAAKVAGITAATGGLRGHRWPSRHHGGALPTLRRHHGITSEDVKLVASNSEGGVQRPCLEMDDWVFAGGEEEMVISAGEPMPRVVFGGVPPTLQEAKEATSELAVALENSVGYEDSIVDTKACVSSELAIAPAVPSPAIMAFKFLHQSTMAQNVVASIACDPNVWNAVLQNQELQEFLQSQRACSACSDNNLYREFISDSDLPDQSSAKGSSEDAESEPGNGFMDIFQTIKSTVVDMMSSLSGYFQNFFGGKGANRVFLNSDGTARLSADTVVEASFIGLAVMAILVILLKRA